MTRPLNILHIGNEMSWRGGENQVRLLIENTRQELHHFVAYPFRSHGFKRFSEVANVLPLPSKSGIDPRNVWAIAKFCRENKIDILDAQSSVGFTWALAVKKKMPHLKLVVHRRVDNLIKQSFFTRRKYLSSEVDAFVAISAAIQDMLIEYGVKKEKIHLVRSAVDEKPYLSLDRNEGREILKNICAHTADRLQVDDKTVFIGNASALTEQKGHDILVQACRILHDKKLNFHCFIAGGGQQFEMLMAMVRELKLESQVTMLGYIQDVADFLSGLDVLVVPSRNEGLGTILLEGVYAGCALVGTSVGGIPEIIQDAQTGLLVPPLDASALAGALEKLIGGEAPSSADAAMALRKKYSDAVRELARREFSLDVMVNGNVSVYQKVMKVSSTSDHR